MTRDIRTMIVTCSFSVMIHQEYFDDSESANPLLCLILLYALSLVARYFRTVFPYRFYIKVIILFIPLTDNTCIDKSVLLLERSSVVVDSQFLLLSVFQSNFSFGFYYIEDFYWNKFAIHRMNNQ